jgi:hypothetical protein
MRKIGSILLHGFVSRPSMILINTIGMLFCVYCFTSIVPMLWYGYNKEDLEVMITTLNGIAGMFVALGVLYEERETILHIAKAKPKYFDGYLNTVAHEDGLGLLVIGLFMEILTVSLEIPNKILDTSNVEYGMLVACCLMVLGAIAIQFDLAIDYIKTYFKK